MYSIGVHIYIIRLGSGNIGEKWKIHYFELQLNPPFRSLPAIRDHLGSNLPCLGVEYLCPLPGQGNDIETYPKHMETKQMDPYNLQVISIFCCCFFLGGPSHLTFFRNVSEKKTSPFPWKLFVFWNITTSYFFSAKKNIMVATSLPYRTSSKGSKSSSGGSAWQKNQAELDGLPVVFFEPQDNKLIW